jgi:hypothetical protein
MRWTRRKIWAMFVLVALGVSTPPQIAYSDSFFSNTIDKSPVFSKELSVYLLDLSGSVDNEIVKMGFENVRANIANVYISSDAKKDIPAASYYQWIPIRGSEANSASLPLFTEEDDAALWSSARAIKGKSNQYLVLGKIRERNGLWSQLMNYQGLNASNCMAVAFQALRNPGLSGNAFKSLNANVCTIALKVRSRFSMVQANIEAFTGEGATKKTTGTDILGTIRKLEDVARNSNSLNRYKKVRLNFVSDMIHQTALVDLKKALANLSTAEACSFSKSYSSIESGFKKSLFEITIYGLGEQKGKSSSAAAANEKLYPPLRSFWDCFWTQKGLKLPDSEFRTLSSFGQSS